MGVQIPVIRCDDVRGLPPVIDLVTAARILGLGRTSAYEMVRRGEWPTPILRFGRQIRVPTAPLIQLIGLDPGHVPSPSVADR